MGAEQAAAGRVGGQENGAKDRTIRAGQCKVVGDGVDRRQQRQSGESGSELGSASAMLAEAEELLREGRAEDALPVALRALDTLRGAAGQNNTTTAALPALNALAEIYLELGDAATARDYFLQAVTLDPDGQIPATQGGGADKFLWLAQLSDEGGRDSVRWFERGAAILRRELTDDGPPSKPQQQQLQHQQQEQQEETRTKLAGALCGMIEVCMTDLSWDPTAESTCERLISEALLIAPQSHSAEPLQTLASIRISQSRIPEARKALRDSLAVWGGGGGGGLEPSDDDDEDDAMRVPDFPTRVSLARLLMEVGMEEEALGVVERLVREDDGSVEAWYLGGWCLYLLGVKRGGPRRKHTSTRTNAGDIMDVVNGAHDHDHDHGHKAESESETESEENEENEEENKLSTPSLSSSREWLRQSLTLYQIVEYEDERLKEHAEELVREIDGIIGEDSKGEDEAGEDEEDGEWNGFGEDSGEEQEEVEEDEDEEMGDG